MDWARQHSMWGCFWERVCNACERVIEASKHLSFVFVGCLPWLWKWLFLKHNRKKRKFSWTGLHGYKILRNLQDWLE
jgi:hypothetical protein